MLDKQVKPDLCPPPAFSFKAEDNKRILYLCGPHGVGKSTLFTDLKFYDTERVREQLTHYDALQEQMTRQLWRASLHCIEHRENLHYAQTQPPNSVVIGDRCFLDDVAYVNAFEDLGWMTPDECQRVRNMTSMIYEQSQTPFPEMFIVVLPPLGWNIDRIVERWDKGEPPKWCEMNFDYLKKVREKFYDLTKSGKYGNMLLLETTNRKSRIDEIKEWINENDLEDFIVEGRLFVESPVGTGS